MYCLDFRSSLVIVSITLEVFAAYCMSDCPRMCFGLARIFYVLAMLRSVYIVTHS
jgi:hypothetical protein